MNAMLADRGQRLTTQRRWRTPVTLVTALCIAHFALGVGVPDASAQANFMTGAIDTPGKASTLKPDELTTVTFEQRLNEQLPLDAAFKDEYGRTVKLGDYFGHRKPVLMAFVYFTCPMLCTQIMNGISSSLRALPFTAGQDFDVVLVSFDPRDTPSAALEKKQKLLAYWNAEQTSGGWHFLTGDEATLKRVTGAAGFTYKFDPGTGQFAHVSGVLVVTPEGRLARYFYGIEYSPKELRLALVESGQGHIGSVVDQVLLYCYHYDPQTGRYGVIVMNLIRFVAILTLAAMGGFFLLMRRRDARAPVEGRV